MRITFEINESELLDRVAENITRDLDDQIESDIHKVVARKINDRVRETVSERLGPVIEDMLLNGVPLTDEYGRARGKTAKVEDAVRNALFGKDSYNHGIYGEALKGALANVLNSPDVNKHIERARAEIKEAVDKAKLQKFEQFLGSIPKALNGASQ